MIKNITKKFMMGAAFVAGLGFMSSSLTLDARMKDIELDPGKAAVTPGNYATMYPTIASTDVTVMFHFDTNGTTLLRVYDLSGREVCPQDSGETDNDSLWETSVDVSTLPNGVYFVELTNNGSRIVNKIVVSH